MTFLVGFLIAFVVGLTGVGAGAITAPVLILFFKLPAAMAVGTALAFAAVIKFAVAPMYFMRKQVHLRILLLLCAGGIPGVLGGVVLVSALNNKRLEGTMLVLVGATVALMAMYSLYRSLQKNRPVTGHDRSHWLPFIAVGIGAEVGFSSAGRGRTRFTRAPEPDHTAAVAGGWHGHAVWPGGLDDRRRSSLHLGPL